ncbi:MAG TPA: hypothetical protein VEQ63_03890, partial [Bryobacteraceae bacterium]|nr:hypothetical protein [Bryobacteraceae bacterium]
LSSPASGPVQRVWYSSDGSRLFARTRAGRLLATSDFENWLPSAAPEIPLPSAVPARLPEATANIVEAPLRRGRYYAASTNVHRSDDGGLTWTNLTDLRGRSILGGRLVDVAVSPANPDEIVVAGETGVWRSLDAGQTWAGVNDKLPNLPASRLFPPGADAPVAIESGRGDVFVWRPGQKTGWEPGASAVRNREKEVQRNISSSLTVDITAAASSGQVVYIGSADGRIHVSETGGESWRPADTAVGGAIHRIFVDPGFPSFALAVTGSENRGRVLRTVNTGVFWEDITANLPAGRVRGITADRNSGAVYVASESGVFMTYTDTLALAPASLWSSIHDGAATDVCLDSGSNQLYAAVEANGVLVALAPHRLREPRVVSAADRLPRAAAPGALVSVLGAKVHSARTADQLAAVLASEETSSELQLPYELAGDSIVLSMDGSAGRLQVGLPVVDAAPGIFVDGEGNPMVLDAQTGLVLDWSQPARSGSRLQIFATGLGRVDPAWPIGLPAPLENAPKVRAAVRVMLNGESLEVTKATLAPGYIGLYLIEVQLPPIVNRGPGELYLQTGDSLSNRVRLILEP